MKKEVPDCLVHGMNKTQKGIVITPMPYFWYWLVVQGAFQGALYQPFSL